jgi:hypothetical protein
MINLKNFNFVQKLDLINGLCLSVLSSEVFLSTLNEFNTKLDEKQ